MECSLLSIQTLKRCLSSTKFKSGVLGRTNAYFVHLIEKGNDDVTKMTFVQLWGWFAYFK